MNGGLFSIWWFAYYFPCQLWFGIYFPFIKSVIKPWATYLYLLSQLHVVLDWGATHIQFFIFVCDLHFFIYFLDGLWYLFDCICDLRFGIYLCTYQVNPWATMSPHNSNRGLSDHTRILMTIIISEIISDIHFPCEKTLGQPGAPWWINMDRYIEFSFWYD